MVNKSVRLWSGMEDGRSREVRLHASPDGSFWFEAAADQSVATIAISTAQLHDLLLGKDVYLEGAQCRASIGADVEIIDFAFDGDCSANFRMASNQFGILARNLGLKAPAL